MPVYTQVKVSVPPDTAERYKSACKRGGVSMAADIAAHMAKQTGKFERLAEKRSADTRRKRREQLLKIIADLENILYGEETYKDNIPENLQSGPAFEAAEAAVEKLDAALELLRDAYC